LEIPIWFAGISYKTKQLFLSSGAMMSSPKVSVIIPTYGGADFLGEAIQSVLDQTFQDFELIVVNNASPDDSDSVIQRFNDPRLRYIKHEKNRGVGHARKNGIHQSRGEIIANLDQDDLFHPDKLRLHVEYFDAHPEVGCTYNSRYELYPSSGAIREILRPSGDLTLADFVLGYPIAPSVWVQRREWATLDEIWDERTFFRGREIVICGRLYMAGCKFALIDRVLNYRRYHKQRIMSDIAGKCAAEQKCQQIIFDDPRCTPDVLSLKDVASANIYAMWAYVAYLQDEVELGRELLSNAVRLKPSFLEGTPPALVNELVIDSIDDEGSGHEAVLAKMFEKFLTNHGISPIKFKEVRSQADLDDWTDYPAIVKPVDNQGQRGVFLASKPEQARAGIDSSLQYSRSKTLIIEEFLNGPEVSANTYISNGQTVFNEISDRLVVEGYAGGFPADIFTLLKPVRLTC
jgi:glycosyltransferase involved in cell wall biosynthesis